MSDQERAIAPIDASKTCAGDNMAYAHSRCARSGADFYKTADCIARSDDVSRLLEKLNNHEVHTMAEYKYDALKEWLWKQTKPSITLKFSAVEGILGFKLPKRSDTLLWWRKHWANGITLAGQETGYHLQRVDFKARRVTYTRDEHAACAFKVPEVFLKGKIPADAATELTAFIEYLRGKYGF